MRIQFIFNYDPSCELAGQIRGTILPAAGLNRNDSSLTGPALRGKYLSVGKDPILCPSMSLAVASILAMTRSGSDLNFSASSSQIGASFLHTPHHGASTHNSQMHGTKTASFKIS